MPLLPGKAASAIIALELFSSYKPNQMSVSWFWLHIFSFRGAKSSGCHVVGYMLAGSFCFLFFVGTPVLSNSSFSWMYSCLHCSENTGSLYLVGDRGLNIYY